MVGANNENYCAEAHLESCQTSTMKFFCENIQSLNTLTVSPKKLHRRCSIGFQMRLRLDVL